ncbi:c-type cytochrome [Pseudomonas sp. EL_65y_Pfl2_R95]|uniref:c-type cytochrome n=1 Tax=Pseudomonas sp. EL_65y_Pfl2_R95 TaxID=3088698 RepID=UPI0030DB6BDF
MKYLKNTLVLLGLFAIAGSAAAAAVTHADPALVKKGAYLAKAADCVACHTTEKGKPFAGGVEFELPFGSLFSPNITADVDTGIGAWTDDDFVSAMQEGVGRDGKHYYPAFPYTSYTLMPKDEILAIKAYLFSLPAVKQAPIENSLSFPFNQRWGMFFWNALFLDNQRYEPDSKQSAEWNRGAYLVQGPGHCGECHTPRTMFQSLDADQQLAGAPIQGWQAYNISSDPLHGIGAWSIENLTHYMATGYASGYGFAGGPMAAVVKHSLSQLTGEDQKAIAVYLKSTPAKSTGVARAVTDDLSVRAVVAKDLGSKIFADACAACHRWDGEGNQSPAAKLAGLKTVNDPTGANLLGVLLNGHMTAGAPVDRRMPNFAKGYNDQELAAVSSFVLKHFGQSGAVVTPEAVAERRKVKSH